MRVLEQKIGIHDSQTVAISSLSIWKTVINLYVSEMRILVGPKCTSELLTGKIWEEILDYMDQRRTERPHKE